MGKNKQARVITKLAHLITKRSVRLSNQESLSASTSIKDGKRLEEQGTNYQGVLLMLSKQITLRLPEEVNEALKKISQQTGINYSNLVLLACWNNVFQFFQNHK